MKQNFNHRRRPGALRPGQTEHINRKYRSRLLPFRQGRTEKAEREHIPAGYSGRDDARHGRF